MQYYLATWVTVALAIYASLIMSIPISGLAAITDGWGLAFGADSTVTVTSSMNGTSKSSTTPRYPAYIKGIDTSLTATALLLMAATYYLVIKDATPLGNYCKLPSKVISANVQALLGEVWPLGAVVTKVEEKYRNDLNSLVRWNFTPEKESRRFEQLLYIGRNDVLKEATLLDTGYTKEQMMAQDNYTSPPQYGKKYKFSKDKLFDPSQTFVPKCIQQCELENQAQERPTTRRIWLRNKSDAVKNLVLLAIWEWISLWLVIITVVSTTIYNGFAASDGNPDRYPRLVLVRVYTFAFVLHFCYTWVCFCRTYTNLVLNGCWTLLSNANFAVQIDDEVFTGIQNSQLVCSPPLPSHHIHIHIHIHKVSQGYVHKISLLSSLLYTSPHPLPSSSIHLLSSIMPWYNTQKAIPLHPICHPCPSIHPSSLS